MSTALVNALVSHPVHNLGTRPVRLTMRATITPQQVTAACGVQMHRRSKLLPQELLQIRETTTNTYWVHYTVLLQDLHAAKCLASITTHVLCSTAAATL
jgi:hypothetical protein